MIIFYHRLRRLSQIDFILITIML